MKIVHWISSFKAKRDVKKLNYYLSWCCNNQYFKVFDYADCWLNSYTLICIRREHLRRRDGKFSRGHFAFRIGWEIRYRERNHSFLLRVRAQETVFTSVYARKIAKRDRLRTRLRVQCRKLTWAIDSLASCKRHYFSLSFFSLSLSRRARARFGVPAASWRNPLYVYNGYNIPRNSIMLTQPRSNSPGMPACARIVNARRCSIATIPRCLSD